ncbi:MAG TPA: hypothetical protein VFY29_11890 [Terriglobia bacterium]|nr:hypothetical protein [Terriglobia bacterium]
MTFRMDDGVTVDTARSRRRWEEATDFNGRNYISRATGDQWVHETLFESAKGRYYIVTASQWQGSRDSARWVSATEAAAWLALCDHGIPPELAAAAGSAVE